MNKLLQNIFSYRPYWAKRFGVAPFLPMSRSEMEELGWDSCDVIIVTGDAYIDHPSFGMAIIGRLLEAQGFRVGIIAQPDWQNADPFKVLGKPNLFFGVTAGNMDSMVNRYTADRRLRHNDSYTPNDEGGKRPDRAAIVYAQRCREAFKDTSIIIGGIEASLRRLAHYDYWSDKVRRSILIDSKADMLIFGNAERALVEVAHRIARGEKPGDMADIRGTGIMSSHDPETTALRLPSFTEVSQSTEAYAKAARIFHLEGNPHNAKPLRQQHGDRDVCLNIPSLPLSSGELDRIYELPYARAPHPFYGDAKIPAWEMIKFSINIMRGCFGGCSFCSITEHEGRIIQSRTEASVLREIAAIRDKTAGFTGIISDLGGPTANMYRLGCKDKKVEAICRRSSCVYPAICSNLNVNHDPLIALYRKAREVPKVKKVVIASGVRYDLALQSPAYVRELVTHHVGGYLKIAPEHTEAEPLFRMRKPGIETYEQFKLLFDKFSQDAGKEQYLIPYFIAAHPGCSNKDMMNLALWLKKNQLRPDQVQAFLPSPMSLASAMYHTGLDPLQQMNSKVVSVKNLNERRLQKAFLRYHDPENWPLLRDGLQAMGRGDLIGSGKDCLVPGWQPNNPGKKSYQGKFPNPGFKTTSFKPAGFKPAGLKTTSFKPKK